MAWVHQASGGRGKCPPTLPGARHAAALQTRFRASPVPPPAGQMETAHLGGAGAVQKEPEKSSSDTRQLHITQSGKPVSVISGASEDRRAFYRRH